MSSSMSDLEAIIRENCAVATICNGLNVSEWRRGQRNVIQIGTEFSTQWKWGLATICALLLSVSAVSTGLLWSICGKDLIQLLVLSTTGSKWERHRALSMAAMRRHHNWLLCSLVIITAACNVSITELLRMILGVESKIWHTILMSTFIITILGKLLPRLLIPRRIMSSWHYCSPLVWLAMLTTAPVSWILARIIDKLGGNSYNNNTYTHEQLNTLVKYHDRLEKHGGTIGPDAARVIRSALDLDGRKVNGGQLAYASRAIISDVEDGELTESFETIIKWSQVKTVSIRDKVDRDFVRRVTGWSYSRIPVTGMVDRQRDSLSRGENTENQHIYGFLHIKDLLDIQFEELPGGQGFKQVKDLPLYPLPVVREDMLIYEILNMFQLGMSRMAVVVPVTFDNENAATTPTKKLSLPTYFQSPWTNKNFALLDRTNQRSTRLTGEQTTWTTGFLQAAQGSMNELSTSRQATIAIRIPCPLGIVTHDDIINALLRSHGIDEKDFFNCRSPEARKKDDVYPEELNSHEILTRSSIVIDQPRTLYNQHNNNDSDQRDSVSGTLRRRHISGQVDGTSRTYGGFDGANDRGLSALTDKNLRHRQQLRQNLVSHGDYSTSSYTQNSGGGFHTSTDDSESLVADDVLIQNGTRIENAIFGSKDSEKPCWYTALARTVSMPIVTTNSNSKIPSPRRVTIGSSRLPNTRQLALFHESHFNPDSDEEAEGTVKKQRVQSLSSNKENNQDLCSASGYNDKAHQQSCIFGNVCSLRKHPGLVLRPRSDSETNNWYPEIPAYSSRTMLRIPDIASLEYNITDGTIPDTINEVLYKDDSFHDDRSFLPSQRRNIDDDERSNGARRTSFWL